MRALLIIVLALFAVQTAPLTARDYYNELYKAGGLDRFADGEVCFDEDASSENFFIFGQSKYIRESMKADGTFEKLTKKMRIQLDKDFLILRGYAKGIPFKDEEYFDKDGSTWLSPVYDLDPRNSMRIRLTINWQTLRYKRAVEMLDHDLHYKKEVAKFGKCEDVSPSIRQTAGPE
jgi:hypothetical protein